MRKHRRTNFGESAYKNNREYMYYYDRLKNLAISMFKWVNLPDSVDERFLETVLFSDGQAIFFRDEVMGELALQVGGFGDFDVYKIPRTRRAFAVNGYQRNLTDEDSVIIYNNMIRTNTMSDVEMLAGRMYNLDRIVDVNCNAQKTPVLIRCDQKERLTVTNLYKEYDGNSPVIFGDKNLDISRFDVLRTDAPFVAPSVYQIRQNIWNEAMTYLGINSNTFKRERMNEQEVANNTGETYANRYTRMNTRKMACKQINEMFGLNVDVEYRDVTAEMQDFIFDDEHDDNMDVDKGGMLNE